MASHSLLYLNSSGLAPPGIYHLQILVPRKEFIQSQESGGMVMASMWNKGTELGMKKFTEPIKRLQLMQQLITSLASQLICLNLF
jgi:hypothetical protein